MNSRVFGGGYGVIQLRFFRLAITRFITGAFGENLKTGYVFRRYPVLKIHHTAVRHSPRNKSVMVTLSPTLTSEIP